MVCSYCGFRYCGECRNYENHDHTILDYVTNLTILSLIICCATYYLTTQIIYLHDVRPQKPAKPTTLHPPILSDYIWNI